MSKKDVHFLLARLLGATANLQGRATARLPFNIAI